MRAVLPPFALTILVATFGSAPACGGRLLTSGGNESTTTTGQAVGSPLYVYAADTATNTVAVINTATNTEVTGTGLPIPVGHLSNGPTTSRIAVTPDGSKVYVPNAGDSTMSVISTSSNNVVATVTLSGRPYDLAISPDSSKVYVLDNISSSGANVEIVSTSSNAVTATIPTGAHTDPIAISVSQDGNTAYLVSGVGQIITVTGGTASAPHGSGIGESTNNGTLAPDGTTWVYNPAADNILVQSPAGVQYATITTSSSPGGYLPANFVFSPGGGTAYSSGGLVISVGGRSVTGSFSGGSGITITPDGSALYETSGGNTISVVSTASSSVTSTITVTGSSFAGIAVQPPPSAYIAGKQLGPKTHQCSACSAAGTLTHDGTVSAGEPIDIASGNVAYETTDYTTAGQNPLAFVRTYNSRGNAPGITTFAASLGVNWRSNFDRYLQIASSSKVIAERAGGRQLTFTLVGSTWMPDTDVDAALTHSGSTWTLTDSDDTVETYTTTTAGNEALLTTVVARNGYTQTLNYNGSNQLTSVGDSYSRSLTIAYNGDGTLHSVTTPDSTTITYGFNSVTGGKELTSCSFPTSPAQTVTYVYGNSALPFAMTGITDENGNGYQSWTYDAFARGLTSQQGNGANLTTLVYGAGATTVTNALGVTETYMLTMMQAVPKTTAISRAATSTTAAASESVSFDVNGYVSSLTDWNGVTTTWTNNSHGLPTIIVEASGTPVQRTTTIVYDNTFVHLPDSIATPGVTTSLVYDGHGDILTRMQTDTTTQSVPYSTNGQTRAWTFTWSNSLLASAKSPNGNTTSYGYTNGALTSVTDALSHATTFTNTPGGRPLTVVDPNKVTRTMTWDPRQRLLTSAVTMSAGVRTTTYSHDKAGNLTQVTLPDNSFIAATYDTAHRIMQIADSPGNFIHYTLDALGDATLVQTCDTTGALQRRRSATFDALGHLLTSTGVTSETTTLAYDKNGNVLTVTDGRGNTTTRILDALNRPSTSTDANSGVVGVTYDAHDRPLTVTDALGLVTIYTYDGFGDVIQEASPNTGTTVYHYDSDANLTSKTDANSIVTNQSFDAIDRVLTTSYPADSSLNVAYTYDQTGSGFSFGIGRLTSLTDAPGTLTRIYDERGSMLSEKRTHGSTVLTTSYTYDAAGRVASVTYPSGAVSTLTRDSTGNVTRMPFAATGADMNYSLWNITHEPFGPVNYIKYYNGDIANLAYDQDYRLTGLTYANYASVAYFEWTYAYDNASNVTSITDSLTSANSQTFGYDVLNRLTSQTSTNYGNASWTFDKNGNVTQATSAGTTYMFGIASSSNRLATITGGSLNYAYGYTANGNINTITNSGTSIFAASYSKANRLAQVVNIPTAINNEIYDAFGRRFSKSTAAPATNTYIYGQNGELLEENDNSTVTDYLYMDGVNVANWAPSLGHVYAINFDRLGVPQLARDVNEVTQWAARTSPYGSTTVTVSGPVTQNLRLPGQVFDAETGMNYNMNRDLFPGIIGRYAEADPIGLAGGMNPYLYASANPLKYTDRFGLEDMGLPGVPVDKAKDAAEEAAAKAILTDLGVPEDYREPGATICVATANYLQSAGKHTVPGLIGSVLWDLAKDRITTDVLHNPDVNQAAQSFIQQQQDTSARTSADYLQWLRNNIPALDQVLQNLPR